MMQLPLKIVWPEVPGFETFVAGNNDGALKAVRALSLRRGVPILLHGMAGTGKTHLLQAAVRSAFQDGQRGVLISFANCASTPPPTDLVVGFDEIAVLAFDEYEMACADRRWAEALIRLIDRRQVDNKVLLFGGRKAPSALPSDTMPDLRSRFAGCAIFGLRPLSEMDQREALKRHARARGLVLDDNVVNFMFHRLPRDLSNMIFVLERLSTASLSKQRRLTVPFVQDCLASIPNLHHSPDKSDT